MDDVRWFAPNAYGALVVPALRELGFTIALEGDRPAKLVVSLGGRTAEAAWRFARRHRRPLALFLWDLPPRSTGRGRPDPVWWAAGGFWRLPRLWGGFPRRRGYFSRLRYIAARADALWAASDFTAATIAERFGLRPERVPYAYDSARCVPAGMERDGAPTLVTVSRLEPHKNHAAVLRAAARLGPEWRVRLIGRGPEADRLRAEARALGVMCTVETDLDDGAVVTAYRTAAVVVAPSRFEGFGLTPVEAIGCGARVVASDIPPHREFIGHAVPLVSPDDVEALARAVLAAREAPPPGPQAVAALTVNAAAERFARVLRPLVG